jgi:hypothetical protein
MEETPIEPEFEERVERLHALDSNYNSSEAKYQVEDLSAGGLLFRHVSRRGGCITSNVEIPSVFLNLV